MSRLRGYSRSMSEVFEETITVRYIASSLASFDAERPAAEVLPWVIRQDYDHIGVRRNGVVEGYALRERLQDGTVGDHMQPFNFDEDVVSAELSLLEALRRIRERDRIFIRVRGGIGGIATRGDVVKPPVRMWLFGLITIFEMQMLRLIRVRYPEQSWQGILKEPRIEAAQKVLEDRKRRHTDVDLTDCLQLCDKRDILAQTPDLMEPLELASAKAVERLFRRVEYLRNDLAHAQEISGHWPEFLAVAAAVKAVIEKAEAISNRNLRAMGGLDGVA